MRQVEDFYKATITQDWSIGTGIFYVSVKPTITEGWLYVSPNNPALREQIYYNGVGTDGNGDYITVTQRGIGTTDEQTHTIGEPIRMNIGEGYVKYLTDAIEDIIAAGTPDADTSTAGKVEIATDAEVLAGTETGGTGAILTVTPKTLGDNFKTIADNKIVAPIVRVYTSNATWTKPAGLRYIEVEVQGGGGAGQTKTGTSSSDNAGAGGAAGGYSKKLIISSLLGVNENITVGSGGTVTSDVGNNGSTSSFGSHLSATGGEGGGIISRVYSSVGGVGSGGDININGGNGFGSTNTDSDSDSTAGGNGGISFFAGGYGSGGRGAYRTSNSPVNVPLAGAPGIVIVKEFYI